MRFKFKTNSAKSNGMTFTNLFDTRVDYLEDFTVEDDVVTSGVVVKLVVDRELGYLLVFLQKRIHD